MEEAATGTPSGKLKNVLVRIRALQPVPEDTGVIAERCKKVNELLNKPAYTEEDKTEIQRLLAKLGLTSSDDGRHAVLNQEEGRLLQRPAAGIVEIVASGRASWKGAVQQKSSAPATWRWDVPFW